MCVRPTFTLLPLKSHHRSQCAFRSCVQRRNSRGFFQSRGPAGLPSRFPSQKCVCNHKKDQPQISIAFLGVFPTKPQVNFLVRRTTTCNFQEFGMHSRMQIALVCQGRLQEICSSHHFNFAIIFFTKSFFIY